MSNTEIVNSPWGHVDQSERLAAGITRVYTPSHGGIHLSAERMAQMPAEWRTGDSWYEEDCECVVVYMAFPELQASLPDGFDLQREYDLYYKDGFKDFRV